MTHRMSQRIFLARTLLFGAIVVVLAACTGSSDPARVVELYYRAIVEKDRSGFSELICPAWEADATLEFDSFGAVEASLESVSCEQTGSDGDYTLVTCQGAIEVIYQGEDTRLFSLEDNTYRVLQSDGEWQMCGYH